MELLKLLARSLWGELSPLRVVATGELSDVWPPVDTGVAMFNVWLCSVGLARLLRVHLLPQCLPSLVEVSEDFIRDAIVHSLLPVG